eukprot:539656-Amphidinium_carterae.2
MVPAVAFCDFINAARLSQDELDVVGAIFDWLLHQPRWTVQVVFQAPSRHVALGSEVISTASEALWPRVAFKLYFTPTLSMPGSSESFSRPPLDSFVHPPAVPLEPQSRGAHSRVR